MPEVINPFVDHGSDVRSLNRTRISSLPGRSSSQGKFPTGYELLSAEALRQELQGEASSLDLKAGDSIMQLGACFRDPARAKVARRLALSYGGNLGYLLLALKRGSPADMALRPEWNAPHWDFFRQTAAFVVGGGLVSGQFGHLAVSAANEVLVENGFPTVGVRLSPYGIYMALVGLARTAPAGSSQMVVLDFGHSTVKRGIARLKDGQLVSLAVYPTLPSPCLAASGSDLPAARARWNGMRSAIAEMCRCHSAGQSLAIGIAVASYLKEGHPFPGDWGCYGSLRLLAPNLERFILSELVALLGTADVKLTLLHDGTAAAVAHAGVQNTVVLALGTAIGSGFAPSGSGYRPVSSPLEVRQWKR